MGNKEKSNNSGCLESIFMLFGSIVTEILNTIISIIIFFVGYILMAILLFFTLNNSQNIFFLCFLGLTWIFICMYFFIKLIKQSNDFKERTRHLESLQDNKVDTFSKNISQLEKYFTRYGGTKAFKLASLTIIFAHLFNKLLIESGSGELSSYFDTKKWNYGFLMLVIAPFLFGIYVDIRSRFTDQVSSPSLSAKSLYFLGAFEFFRNIVVYLTGMLGNKESFLSIKSIDDLIPFESLNIITTDWYLFSNYTETSAFEIYKHLGFINFSFIYIFLPVSVIFSYYKFKKINNPFFPISIVESAHYVSLLILTIPIYVAWHEEWIQKTYVYIVNLF